MLKKLGSLVVLAIMSTTAASASGALSWSASSEQYWGSNALERMRARSYARKEARENALYLCEKVLCDCAVTFSSVDAEYTKNDDFDRNKVHVAYRGYAVARGNVCR